MNKLYTLAVSLFFLGFGIKYFWPFHNYHLYIAIVAIIAGVMGLVAWIKSV